MGRIRTEVGIQAREEMIEEVKGRWGRGPEHNWRFRSPVLKRRKNGRVHVQLCKGVL